MSKRGQGGPSGSTDDVPVDAAEVLLCDEYRCERAATCPKYSNPVTGILADVRSLLEQQSDVTHHLEKACDALEADLLKPVPAASLEEMGRRVLLLVSYVGVAGYILAVLYLQSYYQQVVPGQVTDYPFVETLAVFIGSGLPLVWAVLPAAFTFAASVFGVSRGTRETVHRVLELTDSAARECSEIAAKVEDWVPRLRSAVEDSEEAASAPERARELDEALGSLTAEVAEQSRLGASQSGMAERMLRLVPQPVALGIRLARRFREQHKMLAGYTVVTVVCLLVPVTFAFGASAASGYFVGVLLQIASLLLAVACGANLWLYSVVMDLVSGPGSRLARTMTAQAVVAGGLTLLAVVVGLGISTGALARRFPSDTFEVGVVTTQTGEVARGFQVPILGSSDVVLLPMESKGGTREMTRFPASTIRSLVVSSGSDATSGQ